MSDVAIEVDSVWKKFHRGEFHDSLRDFVPALTRRLLGRGPKQDELAAGDFWALKDVSFQVRRGEVLGIIGRNGAGKSTLLKILSKILKPNRGQIRVNGRLRALIEVAAGFHPDLTGRENIYLNGTILGMKKREIDAKFDEIVEFSGISEFLDTPVKRYSSGMHARLGFAVAAHLEPEILIVDEVLAVGDVAFQKKCLGKMTEVGRSGRTVLFVSHNLIAVRGLCQNAVALEHGSIVDRGGSQEVVQRYLSRLSDVSQSVLKDRTDRDGNGLARFEYINVTDSYGRPVTQTVSGMPLNICLGHMSQCSGNSLTVAISCFSEDGTKVFHCDNMQRGQRFQLMEGHGEHVCRLAKLPLAPGRYHFNIMLRLNEAVVDHVVSALTIEVQPGDFYSNGKPAEPYGGVVFVDHDWN